MRSLVISLAVFAATAAQASGISNLESFELSARFLADSASCTVEQDTDFAANDVANVQAASYTSCCGLCQNQANCTAWSWSDYNDGTCWLKSRIGRRSVSPGVIAGFLPGAPTAPPPTPRPTSPNSPQCIIHQDMDYEDYDIGSVAAELYDDCCDLCNQHVNCTAWSWNLANGGTCWLKSMVGPMYSKEGNVAGALPNAPTESPAVPRPLPPRPTTSSPLPSDHVQWKLRAGVIPARAVNLGGWLVGEHWMSYTSVAWKGVNYTAASKGEYYAMTVLGKERGTEQWEAHRATWITESDIADIAAAGLNAVRVPIGFWIVNDDPFTVSTNVSRVFAPGGLKYLDKLINEWAIKYNLAVMISLHAHQGSQNGFDNSAAQEFGKTLWSNSTENVENSLQFATFIAARYQHSEAFLGLNLMNEPSGTTPYEILLPYYEEAYKRIRATGNDCIIVTSPLLKDRDSPICGQPHKRPFDSFQLLPAFPRVALGRPLAGNVSCSFATIMHGESPMAHEDRRARVPRPRAEKPGAAGCAGGSGLCGCRKAYAGRALPWSEERTKLSSAPTTQGFEMRVRKARATAERRGRYSGGGERRRRPARGRDGVQDALGDDAAAAPVVASEGEDPQGEEKACKTRLVTTQPLLRWWRAKEEDECACRLP